METNDNKNENKFEGHPPFSLIPFIIEESMTYEEYETKIQARRLDIAKKLIGGSHFKVPSHHQ